MNIYLLCCVLWLVAQSRRTLCNPMDCRTPDSSVHGDSTGKKTGVGCHALIQRVFPIHYLNPDSCTAGRFFINRATREAPCKISINPCKCSCNMLLLWFSLKKKKTKKQNLVLFTSHWRSKQGYSVCLRRDRAGKIPVFMAVMQHRRKERSYQYPLQP